MSEEWMIPLPHEMQARMELLREYAEIGKEPERTLASRRYLWEREKWDWFTSIDGSIEFAVRAEGRGAEHICSTFLAARMFVECFECDHSKPSFFTIERRCTITPRPNEFGFDVRRGVGLMDANGQMLNIHSSDFPFSE